MSKRLAALYASDLAVLFGVASLTEDLSAREIIAFNRAAMALDAVDPDWQSLGKPLRDGMFGRCYGCGMPISLEEHDEGGTHSAGTDGDVHEECCTEKGCRTSREWAGVDQIVE